MSNDNQPVLAIYDIRGKQEFIFRTNKIQEIVGASWIIRDCFKDYLFPAANEIVKHDPEKKGIYSYKEDPDPKPFSDGISDGYIGEVVYDGGGNFLVVFESESAFKEVTYEFTKRVTRATGTLRILATCVPVTNGYEDYKLDEKELYAKHRIAEAQESNLSPWACIPIVQVERKTSQPLYDYEHDAESGWSDLDRDIQESIKSKDVHGKLTKESYAKLKKFFVQNEKEGGIYKLNEKILDNIVEEKGVDSQLAIIYIDGNNMGAKVQQKTEKTSSYSACSDTLRGFSDEIQRIYVDEGLKRALEPVNNDDSFRVIVSAGDEINFIVKAKDAFSCAKNYLDYLKDIGKDGGEKASACAGIAVFHSHAPYADAYRIAEEACESGKKRMKETELQTACFVDFHICQGAIGVSLEQIRCDENGGENNLSRPWLVWSDDSDVKTDKITEYETIERVVSILEQFSRSNVKGLATASKKGDVEMTMELNRMYSHLSNEKKDIIKDYWKWLTTKLDAGVRRRLLYDVSIAYDLWFDRKGHNSKDSVNPSGID